MMGATRRRNRSGTGRTINPFRTVIMFSLEDDVPLSDPPSGEETMREVRDGCIGLVDNYRFTVGSSSGGYSDLTSRNIR